MKLRLKVLDDHLEVFTYESTNVSENRLTFTVHLGTNLKLLLYETKQMNINKILRTNLQKNNFIYLKVLFTEV